MKIADLSHTFKNRVLNSESDTRIALMDMLAIVGVVAFWWCWVWRKSSWSDMDAPVKYVNDAIYVLAVIKAFASGEIFPFLFKSVSSLNMPFHANWNDFPFEEWIYFPAGILSAMFGLNAGASLYLLVTQLLAGLSFYCSGRLLAYRRDFVFVCAILFSLSPYAFRRNIAQLTVTAYWHIPLLLLVVAWCDDPSRFKMDTKYSAILICTIGFVAGLIHPYYLAAFLLLLTFVFSGHVINRSRRQTFMVGAVIVSALTGFLLSNADTLLYALFEGRNSNVIQRDMWGLTVWGLRLSNLIFPFYHRLGWLHELGQRIGFEQYPEYLRGGAQYGYIGLTAVAGLSWLLIKGTLNIAAKRFTKVHVWYWMALGIISFGVVGGINYLLGSFGFMLLRSTHRFSIILMAIALFFLCDQLPKTHLGCPVMILPMIMLVFGLYDQLPVRVSTENVKSIRAAVDQDRKIVHQLENELPHSAMIFQLPVKAFPETGAIYLMSDYDQFRPWLYAKNLRFSYGTTKGRGDADWQFRVASLPMPDMPHQLENYGFAAVLINKKAYKDDAQKLALEFLSGGYQKIADEGDFIAFRLNPSGNPQLPVIEPYQFVFESGFYEMEGSGTSRWIWAKADARLTVSPSYLPEGYPHTMPSGQIEIRFDVESFGSHAVWMEIDGSKIMISNESEFSNAVKITLPAGMSHAIIHFTSDRPEQLSGRGDARPLAFRLLNLKVDQLP